MIRILIYGIICGGAIVMIMYALASMFCRWAFASEKWEPKMKNPPPPPNRPFIYDELKRVKKYPSNDDGYAQYIKDMEIYKRAEIQTPQEAMSFEDHMKAYKQAEYNNQLNDN